MGGWLICFLPADRTCPGGFVHGVGRPLCFFPIAGTMAGDEPTPEAMTMPDAPEQLHTTLRTIADYAISDADIEAVAGAVDAARGRLSKLRADIESSEEPAAVFSTPAGGLDS